jgi:hypothetical protein
LANYTNRGFYSFGTNINGVNTVGIYPSPDPLGSGLGSEVITGASLLDMTGRAMPAGASITLLTGTVTDSAFPDQTRAGVRLSTYGAWDQFLQQKGRRGYTLNYYNYDAQAELLVKRGAAYSAGILDYFFRGRMEIGLPDSGLYAAVDHANFAGTGASSTDVNGFVGFGTVRLKLRNSTPDITPPGGPTYAQAMGAGNLVAVAKFHRNTCYRDDLSGEAGASGGTLSCKSTAEEIVVSRFIPVSAIASDAAKEYEFTFDQQIPINATDLYLQVVFRGVLGQEQDAVVVATKDISEPTYVSVINSGDYLRIAGHVYTRDVVNSRQDLLSQVVPQDCVVNNQLAASCFPSSPLNVLLHFYLNNGTMPAVTMQVSNLPTAKFSRVALLIDDMLLAPNVYIENTDAGTVIAWPYVTNENETYFLANGNINNEWTEVVTDRQTFQGNTYNFIYSADGTPITPSDHVDPAEFAIPMADNHPAPAPLSFPLITP